MKKQKKPSIKAHLLWSALILLALLAVCAIPFALAQRQAAKQPVTKANAAAQAAPPSSGAIGATSVQKQAPNISQTGQSQRPTVSSGPAMGVPRTPILPLPKLPATVLYDQLNNPGTASSLSQEFPDFPTFTSDLADDFVVPAGQTWNITEVDAQGVYFNGPGPADNFNVRFYLNSGTLPGTASIQHR